MDIEMGVPEVRAGGNALQDLAPRVQAASKRVEGPAAQAAQSNGGFAAGGAVEQWREAFADTVNGSERRESRQGREVVASADDMESSDNDIRGHFEAIGVELPTGPTG